MNFLMIAIHEKKFIKIVDIHLNPLYIYDRTHATRNHLSDICYQYIQENPEKISAIFFINKKLGENCEPVHSTTNGHRTGSNFISKYASGNVRNCFIQYFRSGG